MHLTTVARMAVIATLMAGCGAIKSSLPLFAPLNQGRMASNAQAATGKCSWGKLFIQQGNRVTQFGDAKVWVGTNGTTQAKEWDWGITNTHHRPGIQIAEIQEFIDQVDEVILTRGVDSVLQIPQETIDWVKSKGKVCHDGLTPDMIELYNKLVKDGKKVGGLFHSTC